MFSLVIWEANLKPQRPCQQAVRPCFFHWLFCAIVCDDLRSRIHRLTDLGCGHGGWQAAGQEISDDNEPATFGKIVIPIAAGWLSWRAGLDLLSNLSMELQIKHALRLEGSLECVLHMLLQ